MKVDVIVIGSGAGGAAAAFHLTQTGHRVLLLERGPALPRDGSTLDPERVVKQGAFLATEPWTDGEGHTIVPEEHFNLGGKTRWYGAALLRFAPAEFDADEAHRCRPWPIPASELDPFYEEAERLLGVHAFPVEPGMAALGARLRALDSAWRQEPLPLGLSPEILDWPDEARHFDGYASARGLKADAESRLLDRIRHAPGFTLRTRCGVRALVPAARAPRRVAGVLCDDGTRYEAETVILAAGALHSPRLLQPYLENTGLASVLPGYRNVGRHYKSHMLTALLALSHRRVDDVLCKTALMLSDRFPHSSLQTLGGDLAADIVASQAPRAVPRRLASALGRRAVGLFLQTEDGSHFDNRVVARPGALPCLDYDTARTPEARDEHARFVATVRRQLLRLGYVPVTRAIPVTGTAHACGTLVTGHDPAHSVVDADGRVHGLENLYVADGSVLPRSSRVNPALTIYAWGLRVGQRLCGVRERTRRDAVAV